VSTVAKSATHRSVAFWTRGAGEAKHRAMSRLGRAVAWMLPFGLLITSIVSVPLGILDEQGLPRYRALKAELAEVERINQRLRREVEQLQRDVEGLQGDPATIERIARDELGMIRADEILFQFPQ
jgi:cell division protein FtsB